MKPREVDGPHDVLARMMGEIGQVAGRPDAGVDVAAKFEGVTKFTLYKQLDPENASGGEMSFVRVWRLVSHFRPRAVAEAFAALIRCRLVALPRARAAEMDLRALNALQREASEAMGTLLAAMADGKITKAEARACMAEIDQSLEAHSEIRARLEAVLLGEAE